MRGAPTVLLFLVGAQLSSVARADDTPPRVAVFPLAGESVSVTDLPTIDAIDGEIRRSVKAKVGASLQPRDATMTHVQVLKDVGLVCAIDDIDCQSRIAIMADVDLAILALVSLRPGDHALRMTLLERSTSTIVARVEGPIAESGPSRVHDVDVLVTRLLVERANDAPPTPAPVAAQTPPTTPAPPTADAAPPPVSETAPAVVDDASPLAWWMLVGGGALAAGAAVALVAAVGGALGVEVVLSNPMPWTLRQPLALAGQAMLVGAVIAGAALVVGGGVAGASFLVE